MAYHFFRLKDKKFEQGYKKTKKETKLNRFQKFANFDALKLWIFVHFFYLNFNYKNRLQTKIEKK